MDIREFLDELYSLWAKTTGAEDRYWMPERNEDGYTNVNYVFDICAIDEEQKKRFVGGFQNEVDVDFITAIHGALPDLVRRTHEALDEADRLDEQRDEQEIRIAGLEETIDELNGRINELEHDLSKASK
ncbi:hypothetical protein [Mycobacteroides abscessus]|uniref:hypothetical protein n=1 Tax=Mycobacteroides abscessus TaxID=36809 RepID=UPI002103BCC8|nr:hypothetical protein [Mycobacteroides abscessus]